MKMPTHHGTLGHLGGWLNTARNEACTHWPSLEIIALQERGEDADAREQPGREVDDGNADPHRAFTRRGADRHQPAHALRDLIEARTLVKRERACEPRGKGIWHSRYIAVPVDRLGSGMDSIA